MPEGEGGVCPGHGLWAPSIHVWGVYESDSVDGAYRLGTNAGVALGYNAQCAQQDPEVCAEFDSEEQFLAETQMYLQQAVAACAASNSINPAKDAGFPAAVPGFDLVDSICTIGPDLNETNNEGYGPNIVTSDPVNDCNGEWEYLGDCSETQCPDEPEGSSSGSAGSGTDCAPFDDSAGNLTYTTTYAGRNRIERDATIRSGVAGPLAADLYGTLYACGDFLVTPGGKLHGVEARSAAEQLGLADGDQIVEVCHDNGTCETDPLGMYSIIHDALTDTGDFVVKFDRYDTGGTVRLEYDVDVQ